MTRTNHLFPSSFGIFMHLPAHYIITGKIVSYGFLHILNLVSPNPKKCEHEEPYLDSGLGEANPHGELLPHEDVRVVGLSEAALQLVELAGGEARAVPLLLAV